MQSISIIGIGRLGGALAIALARAGFELDLLVHRGESTMELISAHLPPGVRWAKWSNALPTFESDIVLIATADPDIRFVASQLAGRLRDEAIVLHTSGSLSSDALSDVGGAGFSTGSIHPLVSVSDPLSGAGNFSDAFFCVEGDETAMAAAGSIAKSLNGRPFSIEPAHKPLYHAAAVMASGHMVALVDSAIEMLSKCGVQNETAKEILLPLVATTVNNLASQSPQDALTGSFARADVEAVQRHLAAIRQDMPDAILDLYLLLGERSLRLAANRGNASDVEKVRELISMAKRKSG